MQLTVFSGVALVATLVISTSAFSADRNAANGLQPRSEAALAQVPACPAGTHWANAGYVRGGKWRDAHCASNNGTD
jgi:hypothetical protein